MLLAISIHTLTNVHHRLTKKTTTGTLWCGEKEMKNGFFFFGENVNDSKKVAPMLHGGASKV